MLGVGRGQTWGPILGIYSLGLAQLFERFAGTPDWDDRATLLAAHDRHYAAVRAAIPPHRLIEWPTGAGWESICVALDLPVPAEPFPWTNRRKDWD